MDLAPKKANGQRGRGELIWQTGTPADVNFGTVSRKRTKIGHFATIPSKSQQSDIDCFQVSISPMHYTFILFVSIRNVVQKFMNSVNRFQTSRWNEQIHSEKFLRKIGSHKIKIIFDLVLWARSNVWELQYQSFATSPTKPIKLFTKPIKLFMMSIKLFPFPW